MADISVYIERDYSEGCESIYLIAQGRWHELIFDVFVIDYDDSVSTDLRRLHDRGGEFDTYAEFSEKRDESVVFCEIMASGDVWALRGHGYAIANNGEDAALLKSLRLL